MRQFGLWRKGVTFYAVILLLFVGIIGQVVQASRFQTQGPTISVTLSDPISALEEAKSTLSTPWWKPREKEVMEEEKEPLVSFLGLKHLNPRWSWSISSREPPLPKWFPPLKTLGVTAAYQHDLPDQNLPVTLLDGNARLSYQWGDVNLYPRWDFHKRSAELGIEAFKGDTFHGFAHFSSRAKMILENIGANVRRNLNLQSSSLSSVTFSSSFDIARRRPKVSLSGDTPSGKTRVAINWIGNEEPTLSILLALDRRNTISPEISLRTARIVYFWKILLDNDGSSFVKTTVDPTSALRIMWTDESRSSRGHWETEYTLPLESGRPGPLGGKLRIRRQFAF